jgi:hypothetical protein
MKIIGYAVTTSTLIVRNYLKDAWERVIQIPTVENSLTLLLPCLIENWVAIHEARFFVIANRFCQ